MISPKTRNKEKKPTLLIIVPGSKVILKYGILNTEIMKMKMKY